MFDSLNWLGAGIPGMVKGAVAPEDPFSKEHWLDSIGVAALLAGGYARTGVNTTTVPTNPTYTRVGVGGLQNNRTENVNIGTGEVADAFRKNPADPLKQILGPGRQSHPEQWNSIISDMKSKGVEIVYKDGVMAYSPSSGKPGQLVIDGNSSIGR